MLRVGLVVELRMLILGELVELNSSRELCCWVYYADDFREVRSAVFFRCEMAEAKSAYGLTDYRSPLTADSSKLRRAGQNHLVGE